MAEHITTFAYNKALFAKFSHWQAGFHRFWMVNLSYYLYNSRREYDKAKTSFYLYSAERKPAPLACSLY